MGSVMDVKNTKEFCDEVYAELDGMKKKIIELRKHIDERYGAESYVHKTYDRHLAELADELDWKIQILSHSCPYDWKGSAEYGSDVQVEPEKPRHKEFSPGYVGG